jgi:hypothetical protein
MSIFTSGELPQNPGMVTSIPHDFVRPDLEAERREAELLAARQQAQVFGAMTLLGGPEQIVYGWDDVSESQA